MQRLFFSLVLCALLGSPVAAQERADAVPPAAAAAEPARAAPSPAQPTDVDDLWRLLRHNAPPPGVASRPGRRFLFFAPIVGSKPSTGVTAGVSANVAFFAGAPASTHISTLTGSTNVSELGQVLLTGRLAWFTASDRWFVAGDGRMWLTSTNAYALGSGAPPTTAVNTRLNVFRLYETTYRNVAPGLFVGGGLNLSSHFDIRPGTASQAAWASAAFAAYDEAHGFASDRQASNGINAGIRYDTRDNGISAGRGLLASVTYRTFFAGFLGGSSTWQDLSLDARKYVRLTPTGRHKLAFWFLGDLVTGGTAPFWDLPATSMDGRSARGYAEGRYRGEHLLYWEAEYRATLTRNGLLGAVLFANVTTIGSAESGERLFKSYAPAAGLGLRVLLDKRSGTNLCADWARGKQGSSGFYLAIQEAF